MILSLNLFTLRQQYGDMFINIVSYLILKCHIFAKAVTKVKVTMSMNNFYGSCSHSDCDILKLFGKNISRGERANYICCSLCHQKF